MDVATVATTAAVTGAINLLIGGVLGGAVRRWIERRDTEIAALTTEVKSLRDNHLKTHIAGDDERFEEARESRRAMHVQIAAVERDYVPAEICRKNHEALRQSQEEFRAAVLTLAVVQEKISTTAAFVGEVNQRVIGLVTDVARMQGS